MANEYALKDLDRRIWFLSLTRFIRAMGRVSSFIFLPLVFVVVYDVSFLLTGLFLGIATLIMAFVQYFSGIWTDRVGRRFFLIIIPIPTVFFYVIMYFLVAKPSSLILLLFAWYGTIISNAIQYPAIQAAVADLTTVNKRLSGFTMLRVMANLGAAVGPLIGGVLSIFGFQYIFLLAGIATVVEIVILYFNVDETYHPIATTKSESKAERRVAYHDRFFAVFILVGIFLGFFLRQNGPSMTLYVFDLQHMPVMDLGYIYALNGLIVVTLQIPILKIMTNFSTAVIWRSVGAIFYAIAFAILAVSNHLLFFLLVMGVMTVGEDFIAPTTQTIVTSIASKNLKGTYIGIYNLYTSIGRFLGTFLGLSLLFFYRSVTSEFWIYIAMGTIAVSLAYFLMNRLYNSRMESVYASSSTS